jgi:tetratricopeptide (TPR) repeat protein
MKAWLAIACLLPAATAAADDHAASRARFLADRGRAAHERGAYDEAVVAFQQAYVIAPTPGLLFNLAQAYRLQGDCDDASIMYRRYLDVSSDAESRALARQHLNAVERCRRFEPRLAVGPALSAPLREPSRDDSTSSHPAPGRRAQRVGLGFALAGTAALGIAGYHGLSDDRGRATTFGIGGALAVGAGATLYIVGRHQERDTINKDSRPRPAQAGPSLESISIAPGANGGARVNVGFAF